jgi:predicted HNH restriction endonuclease
MAPVSRTEIIQDAALRNAPFFRNKANQGAVFSFDVSPTVLAAVDYLIDRYLSPSEVEASGDDISEGARTRMWVNRFERDPRARQLCIDKFGHACLVCGFDFRKTYGDIGTEFIHVHHLIPLPKIGKQYKVNPEKDLRPVCPNCHAMLHRGNPLLSIEELKSRINARAALRN